MAGDVSPVAMLNSQANVFEHTGWMVGLAVDVAGPFTLPGTGAVGLRSEVEEYVKEVGGFKAGSAHQALAGSRFSIPGFSGTGFCQIPGSRDFSGRDLPL